MRWIVLFHKISPIAMTLTITDMMMFGRMGNNVVIAIGMIMEDI